MMAMLSVAAEYANGNLVGADRLFEGVSTDSRSIRTGELFVALQGPNFDGTDYVSAAAQQGAAGAIVARRTADDLAQITVDDTRAALGRLAAAWRHRQSAVVVGITGSNGKTTLKELTAACLAEAAPTLATEGNLNNDIGMPLMLTRINESHRYAVLEMGANHAGEIAYLCGLAEPDVVAITNAADVHLEGFGSVEGVARAKGEILQGRARPGVAVLNADDDYFDYWRGLAADLELLSFGFGESADVRASEVRASAEGSQFILALPTENVEINLSLPGRHNVLNACAAAAIATSLGIAPARIQAGLEKVRPVRGRLQPMTGPGRATIYNDTYNANPPSVIAAAAFLASLPGRSCFVLGDMGELGPDAEDLHEEVGAAIRNTGVDELYAIGELSRHAVEAFGDNAAWFGGVDDLAAALIPTLDSNTSVLVKGSRFMRMERIVDAVMAAAGEGA